MRYLWIPLLLLTGCVSKPPIQERNVPYQARTSQEPMKRVFVLPFLNSSPGLVKSPEVAEVARRAFVTEMLKTNQFVVVKNSDFPKDLESFKVNNEYDLEKIAAIAQTLGVNAVVEGQILELRAKKASDEVGIYRKVKATVEATVRIRAFGASTKKEVFSETKKAEVQAVTTRFAERPGSDVELADDPSLVHEVIQKGFRDLIPPLAGSMKKLLWEGRVAMVRGEKIYINAGRISGIQVGDLLKVVDQGQDIYDPQTGVFLGKAEGRMKGTIEVISYFGKDGSIGVVHSGSDFRENDKVELY